METILNKLKEERILDISKNTDGTFTLIEMCDQYFEVILTPTELMQLSVEIRTLIG